MAFSLGVVTAQDVEITPGPPTSGLVRAFEAVGQNILGATKFFTRYNPGPPDAPDPSVDVWFDGNTNVPVHINVFINPGPPESDGGTPPRTWLRITLAAGSVTLERETDTTIGDARTVLVSADLSSYFPPNPSATTR